MSGMSEAELRRYRQRHPHLFPDQPPAQPHEAGAGLPRRVSNGFTSEAAFQAAAVEELIVRGWDVHESFKGSANGGSIWMSKGFPDLMIYRAQRQVWFAELKQPGNKPTEDQLAYHARLRAAGFRVVVAWTLEDLLAIEEEERP